MPKLKEFAEAGGVIVAFGGSAVLGHHLGLPISDHLVEVAQDGTERPLPGTKYYIPGIDPAGRRRQHQPARVRLREEGRRVLRQQPGDGAGAERVDDGRASRWRGSTRRQSLRSGWAWGQHYLEGGTAAIEASLGKGKVFLFGPEITFRAQPHGTFKFLFN